jgi:hypothetical protein
VPLDANLKFRRLCSCNPDFEKKLVYLVGLYLNPPKRGSGGLLGRESADPSVAPHPGVAIEEYWGSLGL